MHEFSPCAASYSRAVALTKCDNNQAMLELCVCVLHTFSDDQH